MIIIMILFCVLHIVLHIDDVDTKIIEHFSQNFEF